MEPFVTCWKLFLISYFLYCACTFHCITFVPKPNLYTFELILTVCVYHLKEFVVIFEFIVFNYYDIGVKLLICLMSDKFSFMAPYPLEN